MINIMEDSTNISDTEPRSLPTWLGIFSLLLVICYFCLAIYIGNNYWYIVWWVSLGIMIGVAAIVFIYAICLKIYRDKLCQRTWSAIRCRNDNYNPIADSVEVDVY